MRNETNKPFIDTWVSALRSGRYKQCEEFLKMENGSFSAIGVACDILGLPSILDTRQDPHRFRFSGQCRVAPVEVRDTIGTSHKNCLLTMPVRDRQGYRVSVQVLNDCGFSFHQIADSIEYFGVLGQRTPFQF